MRNPSVSHVSVFYVLRPFLSVFLVVPAPTKHPLNAPRAVTRHHTLTLNQQRVNL
ncbi:hypothetical protein PQA67_gp46 [Yersinia phage vB_YenM_56.17]|uniref:Uncharacterized protein n=1 Tax=Yersinia phage vB_YenM_56.17 TaxID=2918927 RepID=A0AAE9FKR0_9CAUD|nr:hypothetical protein PQA67_gp46 [Yersinia phage vB_YenM_56.17]UNA05934.1 hypothetical protein vBYenM5617_046 [Yersinia phage vB_YenM_56.17]